MSIEDNPCNGRLKSATIPDIIKNNSRTVLEDRGDWEWMILLRSTGALRERVYRILIQELGMKKLCAIWAPHLEL